MRDAPTERLRIALLTHSVNPRGGVMHTLALAEALQAAGHAVTVFAPATAGQRMFRSVRCELVLVPVAQTLPVSRPWWRRASPLSSPTSTNC